METRIHERRDIKYELLMASKFYNAHEHINQRCQLKNMAIWGGVALEQHPTHQGAMWWDNRGMGVAPNIAKVRIAIISAILPQMGQTKCPLGSTWSINDDGMVACYNQRPNKILMEVWNCLGTAPQVAKENIHLTLILQDKRLLDGRVRPCPKP